MFAITKLIEWIIEKMSNNQHDSAPEVYIYCNINYAIVAPTICFKTFRGPAIPSELIPAPYCASVVAQVALKKLGECRWCDTEASFDGSITEFFANHGIGGWHSLPLSFEHIVIRQINENSLLVTGFEKRSGDGYVSESSPRDIPVSATAIEAALIQCFDSFTRKGQ